MTEASTSGGSTRVSRMIKAPRRKVYQAFLDPEAVAAWMAPDTMRSRVHTFDPREGGQFRISLTYQKPADSQRGKTSGDTDTYHGRFVQLVPDEKIVEAIEFESQELGFAGEMRMTVLLADVEGGTEVSLHYENVPTGIRPEDNEAGSRSSLQKLAALVE
ncbi:MAG: SRPBCC family protein [Chloroflexi bacterium]|nr:SRPBCC family protein [Chloroflexota bacterium]